MKWPKGKYNGRRYAGVRIDFEFHVLRKWEIYIKNHGGIQTVILGPFHWWIQWAWEDRGNQNEVGNELRTV